MEFPKQNKLQDKYEAWGLTLNITKTKYLSIRKPEHNLSLEGNGTAKLSDNYKYLEVKINEYERHDSGIQDRINLGR
jgi:hypothetical protein